MKKYSYLLILFFGTAVTICAQTTQLKNFDEFWDELKTGEAIHAVIHYGETKLIIDGNEEAAPNAIGGMELNTWEYFAKGTVRNEKAYVSSSETVLIGHPFYGYVYNYAKLRIYEDNSVQIIARYLDPKSFEVKMDETFYSTINNGNGEGAVYFYK